MATTKRFPTLVQLEQQGGAPFQVLGDNAKQPYWLHTEHLKGPKMAHLEAWLVEAIFAPAESTFHMSHVECVSQALLRTNQWDPKGEAEILIFGRPSYQKGVSKMIMNLAHYHRQLRAQGSLKNAAQQAEKKEARADSFFLRQFQGGPRERDGEGRKPGKDGDEHLCPLLPEVSPGTLMD